jgi:hypothetical protein
VHQLTFNKADLDSRTTPHDRLSESQEDSKVKKFLLAVLILTLAPAAFADIKVYNSSPPQGVAGDRIGIRSTLCPLVSPTPGAMQGSVTLTDAGLGTVTMTSILVYQPSVIDIDTTPVFGPDSFIFIDSTTSTEPAGDQTGAGSTTGSVDWGIITGWAVSGGSFCISSPISTCNDNGFMHGLTLTPIQPSSTYDMGTWTFDAAGDYEASTYIQRTSMGGQANTQWDLRGAYVGSGLPALPLVGMGAMALGLLVVGARTVIRKK